MTKRLSDLITAAVKRIARIGEESVIPLISKLSCGKTHALIALYHIFSKNIKPKNLEFLDRILNKII
jgi:predicted AAA+ superfamily ATPase